MSAKLLISCLMLTAFGRAWGASLDVTSSYKMDAISYSNLYLNSVTNPATGGPATNNQSFIASDARLGVSVSKIDLSSYGGGDQAMDVGLLMHALGAPGLAGSPIPTPFNQVAANYPNINFTPFIENAYVRIENIDGKPIDATFGRQSFKLGSGLLLDDDGAGLTGITARSSLPWGMKAEAFLFKTDSFSTDPNVVTNNIDLFGVSFDIPTDGLWQLNELVEHNDDPQPVAGCEPALTQGGPPLDCTVSKSVKSFTSTRYTINVGPIFFDGEVAAERGYGSAIAETSSPWGATPYPADGRIVYQSDAEVLRAKWKQNLYKTGEGIARIVVARGSGYNPSGSTTDQAFYPAHGHQYDGLDRDGLGYFYGATPYSAFGGSYSAGNPSGLTPTASGIMVAGGGYTPPAYKGVVMDLDYYLFQAERVTAGSTTLGNEYDIRFRYNVRDYFEVALIGALFRSGSASDPVTGGTGGNAHKYGLEVSGHF